MDPYLERHWLDVHTSLVVFTRNALNDGTLPGDLVARSEERVVIDVPMERTRASYPGVRVFEDSGLPPTRPASSASFASPILLEAEESTRVEHYVRIVEADGEHLVAVIEYLSPTNKLPGRDRDHYLQKRRELLDAGVNFVEIDLIRAGSWRPLLAPLQAPAEAHTLYRAMVRRHGKRGVAYFPISLREALPVIPIPLRPTDPDVPLDLQAIVEATYRTGRYDAIHYDQPLDPPLDAEDAQWTRALLQTGRPR